MNTNAPRNNKTDAMIYLELRHLAFALTKSKLEVKIPVSHSTKAEAKGNAACMHG